MSFWRAKQRPCRKIDPQQDQWFTPGCPMWPCPQPLYPPGILPPHPQVASLLPPLEQNVQQWYMPVWGGFNIDALVSSLEFSNSGFNTPKTLNLFIIVLTRLNISTSEPSDNNSFAREMASRRCLALLNLLNSWIRSCACLAWDKAGSLCRTLVPSFIGSLEHLFWNCGYALSHLIITNIHWISVRIWYKSSEDVILFTIYI